MKAFFILSGVWLLLIRSAVAFGDASQSDPLSKQVSIYRDNYGVPHIVGETDAATFFGYGYAQAEDHLEDMMVQYRESNSSAVQRALRNSSTHSSIAASAGADCTGW